MKEIKKIVAAYIDNEMSIKSNSVKDIQFRNARAANDMGFDVIIGSEDDETTLPCDSKRCSKEEKTEDGKTSSSASSTVPNRTVNEETNETKDSGNSINSLFGLKS